MVLSKIKGFSKDTIIYGIGDGMGRLISLVMLPILSRVFIPADYGVIDILTVSYAFLFMGINLGVPTGIQRYYYLSKGFERKRMVSSSVFFILAGSVVLCLILILFSGFLSGLITHQKNLVPSIIILSSCLPIEILFNCLVLLLRLNRKAAAFSIINIIRVVITPLLTYIFVVPLDAGIAGIFTAKIISLTIITSGLFLIERHEFTRKINFSIFKKVFLFAIPGHPGILINQAMLLLPRYMLAFFAPMSAVGLFGIAFRITNIMKIYVEAFNRAWNPFAYSNAGKPDEKRLYEIIFKVFAASLIVVCLVLSLFAREVLMILTPAEYHSAYLMVPGLALYFGIKGLVLIFSTLLYTNNKVKWSSYLNGIQLTLFFISALFLIPRYQAPGLVAAMNISVVIYFIFYFLITVKTFYFYIPGMKLIFISFVAGLGIFFFNMFSEPGLLFLIYKIIFCISFSILSVIVLFEKNEKLQT